MTNELNENKIKRVFGLLNTYRVISFKTMKKIEKSAKIIIQKKKCSEMDIFISYKNITLISEEGYSSSLNNILNIILLNIFIYKENYSTGISSEKLKYINAIGKILEKIVMNKINELIYTSFILAYTFFLYPLKTKLSPNKKRLISLLKSLEYKESYSRINEKINKINDINLKTNVVKALYFASREIYKFKDKKKVSMLKTLFLQEMKKNPSTAKKIIEYINKYNIFYYYSYKVLPGAYHQAIIFRFSKERSIPKDIKNFDSRNSYMIPIFQYLDVRLSKTIRYMISKVNEYGRNTEIFIGSKNQMLLFYKNFGYELIAHLNTNSSLQYYFFSNEEDSKLNKVVIIGIGNEAKLNHLLLLLKLGGVDLNKVIIRGSVQDSINENQQKLNYIIEDLPEKIDTVFMGNRSLILVEFAKKQYPKEMSIALNENEAELIAEKLLKEKHNLKTYEIGEGVYKFSYFEIKIVTKKFGIIGFRMPNGSLSCIATEVLIKKGVNHFIMLGAGGSLSSLSQIGSYQLIKSTSYNNDIIHLSDLPIKNMKISLSEIPLFENGKNVTVDSPLLETANWLTKVKNNKFTSTDVETYHIIKGIKNCKNIGKKVEVLPGIFISDVVGECPLIEKIKSRNTWIHLPELLKNCFEYIEKQIEESLILGDSYCNNLDDTFYGLNYKSNAYKKDVSLTESKKAIVKKKEQVRLNSL